MGNVAISGVKTLTENGTITKMAGGILGTAGALAGGVAGLASGGGVSGMAKYGASGATGGYLAGSTAADAVQNIPDRVGNLGDFIKNSYIEGSRGNDEAQRRQQIRDNTEGAKRWVENYQTDLSTNEQNKLARRLAELSADTGVKDYKLANKANSLVQSGDISEKQIRSLLKTAGDIKGRAAYNEDTKKEVQNMVHKKLLDKFMKNGMPEADAKKAATKATKDYMQKLYKLL